MKLPQDYMEGNLSTFGPGGVSATPIVFQTWLPGMNIVVNCFSYYLVYRKGVGTSIKYNKILKGGSAEFIT